MQPPVDLAGEHLRLADGELVAFAAHELDEDRELELAAALHLPRVGPLRVAHAKRDVAHQLGLPAVLYLARGEAAAPPSRRTGGGLGGAGAPGAPGASGGPPGGPSRPGG